MNVSGKSSGLGTQRRLAGSDELRSGDSQAFTLLEILVVVAIMGIVFSISIPFMNTAIIGNKGINGAMKMVQEACSDARALAILKQSTAVFTIHSDGSIDVGAGASSGRSRASSPDVAGNQWRWSRGDEAQVSREAP
jgi:prepilin-type N-terminal cleavage/methylation domain-containing protein